MLPKIKKDNLYLDKKNIKIYSGWNKEAEEIASNSIDWDRITTEKFNYRLRQTPGSWNALGRVKFIFPNNYNVYLHDTPDKELFSEENRTFSHGCIRIEKPIELAVYLLRNNKNWNEEKLLDFLASDQTKTILLPIPVKVFIDYHTIWFDEDTFYFGKDIYGYDAEFEGQFAN